ncbi:hypothetical protein Acr_00g0099460 [Actinidia rufa]|uniref:Retrotransposon Copia-like N-terminal domain-containing protein n=1 Tax=Actinidia rufa TaxID=165716 RepID=A0A7J0DZM6_9ERIC|nr:hypothetical protein Acr_00g0099460 [Actinidia rufa]
MSGSNVDNVKNVVVPPPPPRPDFSLSQHTPSARTTCELLNGKNFAAWSRSVRLFLGGKGKSGWLLGTITKPDATDPKFVQWEIDNCTILGWLFNSMEPRIYHASQASLSLSVADYFAYLQSRWEELAQYEALSEFTIEGGIAARHLDRQHTYQFLMGIALAASSSRFSGGRASSGQAPCSFCGGVTYCRDRCFKLHPELCETFKRNKKKSKASPRTAATSETSYGSPTAPDLHQLQTQFQNQMEQLQLQFQTQLGFLMQQSPRPNPSLSTATLASGTPHSLDPHQGEAPEDPSMFPRLVPLFKSPQVASPTLPPVLTSDPRHMYSRRPPASDPLPQSSPESGGLSPDVSQSCLSCLVSDPVPMLVESEGLRSGQSSFHFKKGCSNLVRNWWQGYRVEGSPRLPAFVVHRCLRRKKDLKRWNKEAFHIWLVNKISRSTEQKASG